MPNNYGRDISRGIISRRKSGRVKIEIGMAYPDLSQNWDRVEITVLKFPGLFPSFLGQKHREESGSISIFPDF